MYEIEIIHTFDAAHRVVGHKGKCANLHGHTYKAVVAVQADVLTSEGFVIDFAEIKALLNQWDHKTILWKEDPLTLMEQRDDYQVRADRDHVVRVPFNPTSENMARHIAETLLSHHGVASVDVLLSETASSSANWLAVR